MSSLNSLHAGGSLMTYRRTLAVAACLLASGCVSSFGETSPTAWPKGTIDLSKRWPEPAPSPFGPALGARAGLRGFGAEPRPNIDAFLKPEYAAKRFENAKLRTTSIESSNATARAETSVAASPPALGAEPVGAALRVASADPPTAADARSELERYRQRDAAAQSQQAFRGGDVIIIGAGTLILILLVVILVLLIR